MIELTQQPDLAIGSKTAIEEFSKKECAKLLVLSDSHGNPRILQSIITSFGPVCDAMCFCGDGIFDLVYALELAFNDNDFGKKIPPVLYFVRGNGDNSTSTIFTDQRISITVPDFQEFSVAGRKIFLTHGHRYGVYYGLSELRTEAVERGCDIVLYGHTHVPNSLKTHAVRNGKKELLAVLNPYLEYAHENTGADGEKILVIPHPVAARRLFSVVFLIQIIQHDRAVIVKRIVDDIASPAAQQHFDHMAPFNPEPENIADQALMFIIVAGLPAVVCQHLIEKLVAFPVQDVDHRIKIAVKCRTAHRGLFRDIRY